MRPPKTFVKSCEGIVDAGMSFLTVELAEGQETIFFGF